MPSIENACARCPYARLQDQRMQYERAIQERQTRGMLRAAFRQAVLESSRQMKRKYSYSAVSSAVSSTANIHANDSNMSKLKKLQKERLIVARLGFPEKAMEIDEMVQKIRDDLKTERAAEDERVLMVELERLQEAHAARAEALEQRIGEEEQQMRGKFCEEQRRLRKKHDSEFLDLVTAATKRAIGRSKSCSCTKKYLCTHNKTASYNTRRPKKDVIHYRRNASRLKHGGRLEEAKAWEEKAAELDARHLEQWREHVARSLAASAWGGSSSALDHLGERHQHELEQLEVGQSNRWRLMTMHHAVLRRNLGNTMAVEVKKVVFDYVQ
ncbi:hypothetical protein JKP88DRAFT_245805 [Tribonema minus]|uniref:Uncharacterized protein n=1 Tax=Tribonema minus TaxID=303371 RepID=A0A836CD74_9STRA|nr:hypothetical protein JKP88DRAFT_245805 [Tribonema minus]